MTRSWPYRITVYTDDPSLFDLMPEEDQVNYEAAMTRHTTTGEVEEEWRKRGQAPRSSNRDSEGFSMQVVEDPSQDEPSELWCGECTSETGHFPECSYYRGGRQ